MSGSLQSLLIIGSLALAGSAQATFNIGQLQWTQGELVELIIEEKDYDAALRMANRTLRKAHLPPDEREAIESIRDLIRDYSDCDHRPLELLFEALWRQSCVPLLKLVNHFPRCRLACYASYLLTTSVGFDCASGDIQARYDGLAKSCPGAVVLLDVGDYGLSPVRRGTLIAPLVLYQEAISRINDSERIKNPKSSDDRAVHLLRDIVKLYPGERDMRDGSFVVDAYVQLLKIYRKNDKPRARQVAHTLLREYPNTRFFTFEYYGWSHPEALLFLASTAEKAAEKVRIWEQLIVDHPDAFNGSLSNGDVGPYGEDVLPDLIAAYGEPWRVVQKLCSLMTRCKRGSTCALTLLALADAYENVAEFEKAIEACRVAGRKFKGVSLGQERVLAEIIEQRIGRLQARLRSEAIVSGETVRAAVARLRPWILNIAAEGVQEILGSMLERIRVLL